MEKQRGRPLLAEQDDYSCGRRRRRRERVAEVVGGTTAECAAVWCCIPCVVVEILVQAVYKVPSELCRKALRKRRRRLAKNGGFPVWDDSLMRMHRHTVDDAAVEPPDEDAVELEREMWNKFSGAGFWRSPSQRTDLSQL